MPEITQVGRVMVPVSDQDSAIAFYRDKLGFEVPRTFRSATATAGSRSRRRGAARRSRSSHPRATTRSGA
jgi:catechol 2,3-dioxygenase-like lactoylglutathione lyase family enzyme